MVLKLSSLMILALATLVGCGDSASKDEPILVISGDDAGDDAATNDAGIDNDSSTEATGCASNDECGGDTPFCDDGRCVAETTGAATLIGTGTQSPDGVSFTEIFAPSNPIEAPDLEFHPTRNELWVLNRRYEVQGTCGSSTGYNARCASLGGVTTILFNPGEASQRAQYLEDENSWHFMRRPPAMAMGANDTFGTCGEAATGNFEDDQVNYIGPTLWSSDLSIYAQPSGGNGSHLDMLHETPFCMGIAHERDNVYWLFNGEVGSIDRYDFHVDHGPGADDHSDGEVHRYAEGSVKRVPNVPSHMVFDGDKMLYIADTGNQRIAKLDTTSGTAGGQLSPIYEQLAASGYMANASLTDVVPTGTLTQPSGIALHDGVLYVTDHAQSKFYAFDLEGRLLASLQSPLPAGSLAGLTVGPNNKIWFTDMANGKVYRLDLN